MTQRIKKRQVERGGKCHLVGTKPEEGEGQRESLPSQDESSGLMINLQISSSDVAPTPVLGDTRRLGDARVA